MAKILLLAWSGLINLEFQVTAIFGDIGQPFPHLIMTLLLDRIHIENYVFPHFNLRWEARWASMYYIQRCCCFVVVLLLLYFVVVIAISLPQLV